MKTEELQDFFEENDFNVFLFEQDNQQCGEIEIWTDGGVDMVITLIPFTKEEFIQYVNDFDMDDEIDLYREDKRYRQDFTISESVKDFSKYHRELKKVVKKLAKL